MSRLLRAFSLVVTDRRWAAPLSATALGFGIFAGVAIGPSASGTLAGAPHMIEIVEPAAEDSAGEAGSGGLAEAGGGGVEAGGGALEAGGTLETLAATVPPAPQPLPPPVDEPVPEPAPAPGDEEPAEPGGTELKGVVVASNPAAGSYALAIAGGELVPVHARELPEPGTKLSVDARQLANGTFAELEVPTRSGNANQVSFTGTVTWAGPPPDVPGLMPPYGQSTPGTSAYAVSGRGASLLVRVPTEDVALEPPAIGTYVKVTAAIEAEATLVQHELEVEPGEPSTYLDLAGIFAGLVPETGQLLLSADGIRVSEADLALTVPPTIDATRLEPGDSYLATAELGEDGALTLKGIAGDERTRGADDPDSAQGDLKRRPSGAASASAAMPSRAQAAPSR